MRRAWWIKLFLVLFLGAVSLANAASAPVGRIALTVGEAKRVNIEGQAVPLRLGTLISEGDRIITGGDAVAIIVFVDEGRISLRADSELRIKQYKVDPAGVNSQLDLELVRGAIRQISGQAARLQPERYRLNTPIASIGVRGTDFLAKTSADAIETFVQEGKIVLLSNLTACLGLAQSGSCAPLADISATDSARYLRILAGGQIERRVVAAEDIERVFGISLAKANTAAAAPIASAAPPAPVKLADTPAKPVVAADAWGHDLQTPDVASKSANLSPLDLANLVALATSPPPVVVPPPPPPVVVPAPPPVVVPALNNTPDLSRQLVWGRFSSADQLPLQLWAPYDAAKEGRSVTVGELGQFALWRSGPQQALSPTLTGEVQFDMRAGQAYFQQGSQVLPAEISNPALSINFDRSTFNSSLTVSQAQSGSASLQVSGKMNDEGVFLGTSPGQRVAGAVSFDAKEAGFLFSRDFAAGAFKGMTLWNAR